MVTYKKSAITKDKIVLTAAQLFAQKGYSGTTIREICASSGVSLSRINYHFASKKELASEIFSSSLEKIDRDICDKVGGQKHTALSSAVIYIRLWLGAILADDKHMRFCADLADDGALNDLIFQVFIRHFKDVNNGLKAEFSGEELRTDCIIFVSSISTLIKARRDRSLDADDEKFSDILCELFMKLLFVQKSTQTEIVDMAKQCCRELT